MNIDLDAERDTVRKYRVIWLAERDTLDQLVAECAALHRTPPADYWQAERAARLRYEAAASLLEALGS